MQVLFFLEEQENRLLVEERKLLLPCGIAEYEVTLQGFRVWALRKFLLKKYASRYDDILAKRYAEYVIRELKQ